MLSWLNLFISIFMYSYCKYLCIHIANILSKKKRILLHLFSFKTLSVAALAATITKWADLSEEGDADFALEMRNGV